MGNELVPDGRYLRIDLPEWGIVAHWVISDDDGKYIALRAQCAELKIAFARQLEKVTEEYPEAVREFRVETAGGRQIVKCLRKAEAAMWLASIHPGKVREDLRENFEAIRARILMVIDRTVWGDMTDVRALSPIPPRVEMTMHLSCLRCHTPHVLASDGRHTTWEMVR